MTEATIIIECESCASGGETAAARIESEGGEEGDRLRRVRVAVKHVAKAALYVVETVFLSIHFAFLHHGGPGRLSRHGDRGVPGAARPVVAHPPTSVGEVWTRRTTTNPQWCAIGAVWAASRAAAGDRCPV